VSEADRPVFVRDLVLLDVKYRRDRGETPTAQEYQARFSDVALGWVAREIEKADRARAGRYQLFGRIGIGGMGEVLRGRDPDLNRELALKVLLEQHAGRPEVVRRFVEEAQIGGQLQHPGIVPVYELGRYDDGRPFFTMKLVKGRTLAALLSERSDPAHDRPRFLTVFEAVCQTVAYAHDKGVIHRDLKPLNVMVGAFGEVQVMDWGLAKVLGQEGGERPLAKADTASLIRTARGDGVGSDSRPGSVMGTPAYMAREQALGEVDRLDRRCDVFGLGAVLCEILTGQPPYLGPDSEAILRLAARADLADALARLDRCGADAELVTLAKRLLAAEQEDRPPDAGVVAEAVAGYLAGVEERLRATELERAAAEARAQEAKKTAAAEHAQAEEARKTAAAERRAR
jgi:eukaryotic-like serine/threonine-protein kinase